MELGAIIFVFIFFSGNGNEYRNLGNKYGNRYYRKQKRSEYDTETETEADVHRNKEPLNRRKKHNEMNKVVNDKMIIKYYDILWIHY